MSQDPTATVTEIITAIESGDEEAAERFLPVVYQELKRLARARMAKLPPGNTLQPTALVHEVYLRLAGSANPNWVSRGHFFGAAARAMWQILVEQARRKGSVKHGGHLERIDIDNVELQLGGNGRAPAEDVLALDEALDKLGRDSRETHIVLLKYFAGFTNEEVAAALGVSLRTVEREWRFARVFLYQQLSDGAP